MKLKTKLVELADRYLVEDWRDCLKWLSVQGAALLAILAGLDAADVAFVRELLPEYYQGYLAVLIVLARVKRQE